MVTRASIASFVTFLAGSAVFLAGCGPDESADLPADLSTRQQALASAQGQGPSGSRLDISPPPGATVLSSAKSGVLDETYAQAAQDFAAQNASRYAFATGATGRLEVLSVKRSLLGVHVTLQETIGGIPVAASTFTVSFDNDAGKVYRAHSAVVAHEPVGAVKPRIGEEAAYDVAWQHLGVAGELISPPRVALTYVRDGLRANQLLLVHRVGLHVSAPAGEWQVDVDAASGAVVGVVDTSLPRYKTGTGTAVLGAVNGPLADRAAAFAKFSAGATSKAAAALASVVSGTGKAFDPDPMTTLVSTTLSDTSPASAFTAAYKTVTLSEISLNAGVYKLEGPWAKIVDFEAPNTAPSTTTTGNWTALRGNNAFNDVMTYFHIDRNQRYLQSLGYTGSRGIQNLPIGLDSNGFSGSDNSHYVTATNQISYGHGGVDDNEDADVILHEYNHALDHGINPSWGGGDTGAMGEGFGDYWGASNNVDTFPAGFDNAKMFTWDANTVDNFWPGRRMDRTSLIYDPSQTYFDHQSIPGGVSDELWSTPLFQGLLALRSAGATKREVDTILLEARFGLGSGVTMRQMATAIVDTAKRLYPLGPHAGILSEKFFNQNILLATDWGLFAALVVVITQE